MIKVGRYTAALLLLAVGGILIADRSLGTDYLSQALSWWPVLLISFGIEFLLANGSHRDGRKPMRMDFGSLFFSVLICVVVIALTQSSALQFKFLNGAYLHGIPFEKDVTRIPLDSATRRIVVDDPNGNVTVAAGDVEDIEIAATVYVSGLDRSEAQRIADQSKIVYSGVGELNIAAQGREYPIIGFKRKPRMDLNMTVPRKMEADVRIALTNGSIRMDGLDGNVAAKTTNGSIAVSGIGGDAELNSLNGGIAAEQIGGDLTMRTTNGGLEGKSIQGKVEADTVNGKIALDGVSRDVGAESTNGSMRIASRIVGGDWRIKDTVGSVNLSLPADGDYRVSASAGIGRASADSPFTASKHQIEGTIGEGTYLIDVHTNGSISLHSTR